MYVKSGKATGAELLDAVAIKLKQVGLPGASLHR